MPNRDKTGPQGEGPLTGRGRGPCKRTFEEVRETAKPKEKKTDKKNDK